MLGKLGHPGAALDDAYIHFQYARAIAEGHPLRFQAGEPISTGATSFLWPALLAVPYALGVRGESILWATWVLSFVALGALAYETYAISRPLAGRARRVRRGGDDARSSAASPGRRRAEWRSCRSRGCSLHSMRRASEWTEEPARRTPRELRILLALALARAARAPGRARSRPSCSALAVAAAPARSADCAAAPRRCRSSIAAAAPNLLLLALTGHATSSTAQVKLLVGNPYFAMPDAAIANARILVGQILDGQVWSAEFLPKGGAPLACAGLAALAWRGHAASRPFRAAVGARARARDVRAVPLRHVPLESPALPVAVRAGLVRRPRVPRARASARSSARVDARAGAAATTLVAGGFAGTLAVRLDWVIDDAAQSASGIDRQQVALGRWADATLPRDARIGVNDTGAIAYFGNRKTFDVVGLTTPSEGRYWVAGAGSRLEHYERLRASSPASLPTHFIVYPEWMSCDAVLGKPLHEAVVTDSTILGGQMMRAYEARYEHLGSGELPWSEHGTISDTLDVADLESEAEHRYELLGARDGEQIAEEGNAPDGRIVVDGGRTQRISRALRREARARSEAIALGRVQTAGEVSDLEVRVGGRVSARRSSSRARGRRSPSVIPGDAITSDAATVEVSASGSAYTSFHWWFAVAS